MIIGTILQQPDEYLDYDVDFSDFLDDGDTIQNISVEIRPFANASGTLQVIAPPTNGGNIAKIWVSGGEDGDSYTIEVTVLTNGGRQKQDEIEVEIEEF